MKALLVKSQFVEVEGLTAFGPRFLDESLKPGAETLVFDDFFPTLVALCKLTQLIKHGATLSVTEFWQLLDDFRCAHGSSILCRRVLVSAQWRTRGYAGRPFRAISCISATPAALDHMPSWRNRPSRSSHLLDCISLAPARLDRYLRGCTGHLAHPVRSIVSRSLPLVSTATFAAVPAISLIPFARFYLARSRSSRPLPSRLYRPSRSSHLLDSICSQRRKQQKLECCLRGKAFAGNNL